MKVNPEVRPLVRAARKSGWHVEQGRGGHVRFVSPAGALVIASSSSSDHRAWKNLRALLRRHGLEV